MENWK
jgi:hypothetical protein